MKITPKSGPRIRHAAKVRRAPRERIAKQTAVERAANLRMLAAMSDVGTSYSQGLCERKKLKNLLAHSDYSAGTSSCGRINMHLSLLRIKKINQQ